MHVLCYLVRVHIMMMEKISLLINLIFWVCTSNIIRHLNRVELQHNTRIKLSKYTLKDEHATMTKCWHRSGFKTHSLSLSLLSSSLCRVCVLYIYILKNYHIQLTSFLREKVSGWGRESRKILIFCVRFFIILWEIFWNWNVWSVWIWSFWGIGNSLEQWSRQSNWLKCTKFLTKSC